MQTPSYNWKAVARILQNAEGRDTVQCVHPGFVSDPQNAVESLAQSHGLSFLDSLGERRVSASSELESSGRRLRSSLSGLINQLNVFDQMSRCPILGITGMLNSGKSTLLSTYLSPVGRARILRGLSNQSGTHRFVLWLPTYWRDQPDLLEILTSFLGQLFGNAPESLSDDPQLAARQYNGQVETLPQAIGDPMAVPLVGYDPGLNAIQLGLLDCPDIQTGYWSLISGEAEGKANSNATEFARRRQDHLASVGRLCSAFIVMSKMNSLHDQGLIDVLTTLRDSMPGVPRILAVNRVKSRYSPEVVAEEARGLVERFSMRSVFVAYDYRSSLSHTRIPKPPEGWLENPDGSPQPIFFEALQPGYLAADSAVHQASGPLAGNVVGHNYNYLYHLGQQLDPGSLSAESCRSLVLQLKSLVLESIQWQLQNSEFRKQQLVDAWQAIAEACFDFMAQRDSNGKCVGLRLQTSPAIIGQMSDSLRRTAPFWLKPSLAIDRTARQLQQAVAAKVERFKLVQNATQVVSDFAKKFRRGEGAQVVTPDRLARSIRNFDVHDSLQPLTESTLLLGCAAGLERFAAEEQPELDEKALDNWTASVWKNMNWRDQIRRGVQPLALLTGPLLAALLIPFDSGGTAVLVFATTHELLAAAGIAVLLPTVAGGGEAVRIIHEETPWRQLGDLFAALCDSLGLPRPDLHEMPPCGSDNRLLPNSRLPVRSFSTSGLGTEADESGETHVTFSVWKLNKDSLHRLQTAAERLI